MILFWLLVALLAGGVLAWIAGLVRPSWARWVSLAALFAALGMLIHIWVHAPGPLALTGHEVWLSQLQWSWIPRFGISFHLGIDGLSLLLSLLTVFLGIVSVFCSWTEIRDRVGFFHLNLMWSLAGVLGVFFALDMFLFFLFWEAMLVPMYLLIAIWGHENRTYASIKFFIFTQASSLFMLISILALVFVHQRATGTLTFDYLALLGTHMGGSTAFWLMFGFFAAFAVKLPAVPVHVWLPDAHTEAPTAGSVILAGVLLKTGAYGLIRFAIPLFPSASAFFTPAAMAIAVTGILYGAVLAFAQTDFKRLVAYSSISHLGFVLLGIYAWNVLALQGAVMQMLAHGVSTGALFVIAGALQERLHTRDMTKMGGLWTQMPRMGAIALFFAIASLGLPGLGNFVGEFLVLLGTYAVSPLFTVLAALGLIMAVVYSLILMQRSFQGAERVSGGVMDFSARELGFMSAMILVLVWLGLYPLPVLDAAKPALGALQHAVLGGALVALH